MLQVKLEVLGTWVRGECVSFVLVFFTLHFSYLSRLYTSSRGSDGGNGWHVLRRPCGNILSASLSRILQSSDTWEMQFLEGCYVKSSDTPEVSLLLSIPWIFSLLSVLPSLWPSHITILISFILHPSSFPPKVLYITALSCLNMITSGLSSWLHCWYQKKVLLTFAALTLFCSSKCWDQTALSMTHLWSLPQLYSSFFLSGYNIKWPIYFLCNTQSVLSFHAPITFLEWLSCILFFPWIHWSLHKVGLWSTLPLHGISPNTGFFL